MLVSISSNGRGALRIWFNCAYSIFLLLLLFLSMLLRKARGRPHTMVSQITGDLYDRWYIPCVLPSL